MADGATCSVHGKKRTMANLENDGAGGMCCTQDSQCKDTGTPRGPGGGKGVGKIPGGHTERMGDGSGGGGGGGESNEAMMEMMFAKGMATALNLGKASMDLMVSGWGETVSMLGHNAGGGQVFGRQAAGGVGEITCSVHGKKRGLKNMQDDGVGGKCCAPGMECKAGSGEIAPVVAVYGGGHEKVVCSMHGKTRGINNMMEDGAGGHCCQPGMECKGGPGGGGGGDPAAGVFPGMPGMGGMGGAPTETVVCSIHGKNRGVKNMTSDGAGGMCCAPGMECKAGGGGGKGGGKGGNMAMGGAMAPYGAAAQQGMPGMDMGQPDLRKARPGDWVCEGCGDNQFGRNQQCRKCGTPKPGTGPGGPRFTPF